LATGFWSDLADIARHWALEREFTPAIAADQRERLCRRWREAVRRSLDWAAT